MPETDVAGIVDTPVHRPEAAARRRPPSLLGGHGRFTAYDAASIAAAGFEGGKMLVRIDPADPVTELAAHRLLAMVEPALILGGEVSDDPDTAYASWAKALELPTVQGLVIGRSLLYPPGDDVAAAVDTAVGLL